jgi:hypothetical protein
MPRFAATNTALEKGVENIKPDAAIKIIADWEQQLEGAEFKGAKGIVRDLGALRKELEKGDKLKGERVQQLTAKLGQATVAAAGEDERDADKLRDIGEKLAAVGDPNAANDDGED